jgi:biopolymer transport protein ExbB/TolQ
MGELLHQISAITTPVIAMMAALHLFLFFVLWIWSGRDLRNIASALYDFTRGLKHQSVLDRTSHLSDQIDAFLADVRETLEIKERAEDRSLLLQRIRILDEKRRYLQSMSFETIYNIARTMIEAYPLLGVLGTILAIGAALQTSPAAPGATADTLGLVLARFGEAIWSTAAGLAAAMLLMFVNSSLEMSFARLAENRRQVRDVVARVKRELAVVVSEAGDVASSVRGR